MANTLTERMKIIFNDDEKVIDFLTDLEDRSPIKVLDDSMKRDKDMKGCLITQHIAEGIFSLLLFNDPFKHNEDGNILMLFTNSSLGPMISYFQRWLEDTAYCETDIRLALQNIISVLKECQNNISMKNTQTNYMG